MTTIKARKITGPPLFLLPVVLLVVLFGGAVLLAQIAPGRVTTGIYQVFVGDAADPVVIPPESLSCARTGDTTTCGTPIGSHRLTVSLAYTGVVEPGPCTARYDGRTVACTRLMGFYGHGSVTVGLPDGLDLSAAREAELRAAVPWWRVGSTLGQVSAALTGVLAVLAGAAAFLLRRRARPVPPDRRGRVVAGTAVLGLGLFVASGAVMDGGTLFALSPFSIIGAGALAVWQWELSSIPRDGRLVSVVSAVTATVAVVVYATTASFTFLVQSGFIG